MLNLLNLILISSMILNLNGQTSNVNLNLQNLNFYNGPENIGIGMGHSSLNGNWLRFLERLNVNSARLFVTPISDIRKFLGSKFGQNLAITSLRSLNGRNSTYPWSNPVQWKSIFDSIAKVSRAIYGSDENTINKLISLNVTSLLVLDIKCSNFLFSSFNNSAIEYWQERWELYKYSYALAVWARQKNVSMIEFYNEPDLDLGVCLDSVTYKEFYFIRSLSIQNAYNDLNMILKNYIDVKIAASAFARVTYGGDSTRYLGDISVQNKNLMFGDFKTTNWSNMDLYSYHTYGKTGYDLYKDILYLQNSVQTDAIPTIPVIVTEYNSHTSSNWNSIQSTPDDDFEASRFASELINLIVANVPSHYAFKFSITPSFSSSRDVAMNGLHWGDIYSEPFHISDTTLSAEAMRLLNSMKKSKIYPVESNETSKYRNYLLSKNENENFYYLYAVNDKYDSVNLNVNLAQLKLAVGSLIAVEIVASGYWGEISSFLLASYEIRVLLRPYSVMRIKIPTSFSNITSISPLAQCTLRAGSNSNQQSCSDQYLYIGTSNTAQHENTAVAFLRFKLNNKTNSKSQFYLNLTSDLAINMTITVLGLKNVPIELTSNNISWNLLSSLANNNSVLTRLSSGVLINSIDKNFINWSSLSDISIAGHFTAIDNRYIDVTEYVQSSINRSKSDLVFIMYRPFRYPSYNTGYGSLPADNISNGAQMKISAKLIEMNL